jgi:hypothetical protein
MSERRYDQAQVFGSVIDVLEAVGAVYAIWGGVAAVAYGEPRFTQDMDILLRGDSLPVEPFVRRLREGHFYIDPLSVQGKVVEGGFFNVIHEHYAIKVDFYVPTEPELLAMIAERIYLPFDRMRRAAYISPTALVEAKLQAYVENGSTRHLDDIAGIVRVQDQRLDVGRLDRRAAQLGCFGVWRGLWQANRGVA